MLNPTLPYILICTALILCDCYTAWKLSKRVKAFHPDKVNGNAGKFKSSHFKKVLDSLFKAWVMIIIAYFIQLHITDGLPVDMTKIAAGAISFWQLWSILENESSCNGARWAKVAQKILVDKTSRHFDINLSELSEGEEEEKPTPTKE